MDPISQVTSETMETSYEAPQSNMRSIILIVVIVVVVIFFIWLIWYMAMRSNSNNSGGSGSSGSAPPAAADAKAPAAPAAAIGQSPANDFVDDVVELPEVLSVTPQKGETSGETISENLEDIFKENKSDLSTPSNVRVPAVVGVPDAAPAAAVPVVSTPVAERVAEIESKSDLSPPQNQAKTIKLPKKTIKK